MSLAEQIHRRRQYLEDKFYEKIGGDETKQAFKDLKGDEEQKNDKKKDLIESLAMGKVTSLGKATPTIAIGGASRVGNPLKPTITEIPTDVKQLAELVKVSSVWEKAENKATLSGIGRAKKRLALNSPGYTLDTELSTPEHIVVRNPQGKVTVAFRGTNPKSLIKSGAGKNIPEPIMWLNILFTGNEGKHYAQHDMEKIRDQLLRKYDINDIEHITGYSMGGTKAHRLANLLGKDSTTFNPLMGKRFFDATDPNTTHRIIRTTEDVATTVGIFQRRPLQSNIKIESIDPIKRHILDPGKIKKARSLLQVIGLLDNHHLDHFVQEGDRASNIRETQEIMNEKVNEFDRNKIGKTPEEINLLQKQLIKDVEPYTKVLSQEVNTKLSPISNFIKNKAGLTTVNLGAGIAGSLIGAQATSAVFNVLDIPENQILESAIGGTAGQYITETFLSRMVQTPASFARSLAGGGGGAVVQELTAQGTKELFKKAGMDEEASHILSQTIGGGMGGGATYAIPQAGARISTALGSALSTTSATAVETAGIELGAVGAETALLGTEALAGAETALLGAEALAETTALVGLETLGTEASALALAEVGAVAVGEQVVARGIGTVIGGALGGPLGAVIIGSILAGGLAIFQADQMRKAREQAERRREEAKQRAINAPMRPSEEEFLRNSINYFASGGKVEDVLKQIKDEVEKTRMERFLNSANYQQEIRTEVNVRARNAYEVRRYGATRQDRRQLYEFAKDAIPNFNNLTNKERNEEFRKLLTDPRYENFLSQFSVGLEFNEEDPYNDPEYLITYPQIDIILAKQAQENIPIPPQAEQPAQTEQQAQTEQEPQRQVQINPQGTHALNVISRDERVRNLLRANDIHGVNKRIREIFTENKDRGAWAGDTVIYGDAELPQFTSSGQLKYQKMETPPPTSQQQ